MFQRCWSGSRALKRLTSTLTRPSTSPAVTTPKLMWVESSQWWLIGASGESMIASRCMKAGGPNAGSPGKAGVEEDAAVRGRRSARRMPTAP